MENRIFVKVTVKTVFISPAPRRRYNQSPAWNIACLTLMFMRYLPVCFFQFLLLRLSQSCQVPMQKSIKRPPRACGGSCSRPCDPERAVLGPPTPELHSIREENGRCECYHDAADAEGTKVCNAQNEITDAGHDHHTAQQRCKQALQQRYTTIKAGAVDLNYHHN